MPHPVKSFLEVDETTIDGLLMLNICSVIGLHTRKPGPSCSKQTTSLVNDLLKFTSSDTHIC